MLVGKDRWNGVYAMAFPWQIATSSAAGALITLIGVFVGAALTRRTQERQWSRDRRVEACTEVIVQATRIQRALWRRWEYGEEIDWGGWNEALAALWLLGDSELVAAAARIDETFFCQTRRVKQGEIADLQTWRPARGLMEAARLNFINVARKQVLGLNAPMTKNLPDRPGEPMAAPSPGGG
jgi:hypothetical protein